MPEIVLRNRQLRTKQKHPLVCAPLHPNAGLRQVYQRKLDDAVAELHNSIMYWLKAAWRKEPTLAMDATAAQTMQQMFRRLGRRWERRFEKMAPELADYFAQKANKRVSSQLQDILKRGGMSVDFVMSKPVREAYEAVIAENVGLIKSIAREYLGKVEQEVMRSVAAGRDLGTLADTLQAQYGSTRRRAALIARDQNNKAVAIIARARQMELGITQAKWRHSRGGRQPRPAHVAMDGQLYDVAKGMWDPHEEKYVIPGELINCRCVSMPVIPGFE